MEIISIRDRPQHAQRAVRYFQSRWGNGDNDMVYQDCIMSCLDSPSPLPQWYLLCEGEEIAGGAGLITNDFISRGDLWPWLCALYVEEEYRGHAYGARLMGHVQDHARALGFEHLYLCTDHDGYYERYGFEYLAQGYHPWGESSRIYRIGL